MEDRHRIRLVERHLSVTIRALSRRSDSTYRGSRLFVGGVDRTRGVPHLAVDPAADPVEKVRGVGDSIALRLLHSDDAEFRRMQPQSGIGMLVYGMLEQLRCESLADTAMVGMVGNVRDAFDQWCRESRGNGLIENELGLIVYGIAHIARIGLTGRPVEEAVEGLIESVRFQLAPVIGEDLRRLRENRHDQRVYARHARSISDRIMEIARQAGADWSDRHLAALRSRNLLPPAHEVDRTCVASDRADGTRVEISADRSGYGVFCRDHDRTVGGEDLYRIEQRQHLRLRLDRMVSAQAVSVTRLALRLKMLFSEPHRAGWHEGEEEGYVDGRRLGQMVAQPGYTRVFRIEKPEPRCDTVLTFLLDNSGSMKRQKFETIAVLVDLLARALELAGVRTEILGFTTGGWAGGESIKVWKSAGQPERPGRLNDRLHIVYKDADTKWRRARYAISSLLNPAHFREGLDGEALAWAAERLLRRPESRRCLMMISDGAPMETATSNHNDPDYLDAHLREVAGSLERSGMIELKALGVDLDMENYFRDWATVDLSGTLDTPAMRILETLFPTRFARTGHGILIA